MLEPWSRHKLTLVEPGNEFYEIYDYHDVTTDKPRATIITYIYLGDIKHSKKTPKLTHKVREVRRIDRDTSYRARGNTMGSGPFYVQRSWFQRMGFDVKEDE